MTTFGGVTVPFVFGGGGGGGGGSFTTPPIRFLDDTYVVTVGLFGGTTDIVLRFSGANFAPGQLAVNNAGGSFQQLAGGNIGNNPQWHEDAPATAGAAFWSVQFAADLGPDNLDRNPVGGVPTAGVPFTLSTGRDWTLFGVPNGVNGTIENTSTYEIIETASTTVVARANVTLRYVRGTG